MEYKRQQFEDDVACAVDLCAQYGWPFVGFSVTENSVSFSWHKDETNITFNVLLTDDYPEKCVLSRSDGAVSEIVNRRIPSLVQKLREELCQYEHKTRHPALQSMMSVDSDVSEYADCHSNMESDDDVDNTDDYEMVEGIEYCIHSQLDWDITQLQMRFGEDAFQYRLFETIDNIDMELNIPLLFLGDTTSQAWKLNKHEPLVIRLHLSLNCYLDAPEPPRVEVFQPTQKEKSGVATQMKKIIEQFLSVHWREISNEKLQKKVAIKSVSVPTALTSMSASNDSHQDEEPHLSVLKDTDLALVMETGFSAEVSRNALIITRGNVQEALNLLASNPDSLADQMDSTDSKSKKSFCQLTKRQSSYPSGSSVIKKAFKKHYACKRQHSMTASTTAPDLTMAPLDLSPMPTDSFAGKNAKTVPSLIDGFLAQVYQYARQRIPTLNEYCVVCDEPHVFQNGAMLKPAVCSRELCVFAFQTLGVMGDAADDIATGAEVVDLLVAMSKSAALSNRKKTIFDPYPTIVDPENPSELALHPKAKDYEKIEKIVQAFPTTVEMTRLAGAELKKQMDARNKLIYPLLQWIISSNRSHIVKLPPDRRIGFMHTPHQFLLLNSPPAKEAAFRAAKQKYGSTFAFHGSSVENWHSIIRNGLIVASGTKLQVNGAAHGKGIYLSPNANVSFGYSRMGYGSHTAAKKQDKNLQKNRFLKSTNITCIALCEVIVWQQLKKNHDIWVCPEPDYVCTRFFFVYEDGQVGDSSINTQDQKNIAEIHKALGTVEIPVLRDLPFGYTKVVYQDRWSPITGFRFSQVSEYRTTQTPG